MSIKGIFTLKKTGLFDKVFFCRLPDISFCACLLLLAPFKKYYTQAGNQDDLISIGTIGLIKGISTFKPDKNVRLATYASRCIENAIHS